MNIVYFFFLKNSKLHRLIRYIIPSKKKKINNVKIYFPPIIIQLLSDTDFG